MWSLEGDLVQCWWPPGLDKHLERTRRLFFHQTSSVLSQVTTEPSCSKQNYDADRVESTFQSFPCGWCLFLRSRQAAIQNFPAPFFSKKKEKEKVYMFFVLHGSLNPTLPAVRQIKSIIILPINLECNCGCGAVKHEPVSTKQSSTFKPSNHKTPSKTPLSQQAVSNKWRAPLKDVKGKNKKKQLKNRGAESVQLERPGDERAVEEQGVGAGSTEEPLTSETTKWRQSKVDLRRTLQ